MAAVEELLNDPYFADLDIDLSQFSEEEKSVIIGVMQKAKDFNTAAGDTFRQPTEGQLSKWTNMMKGWQYRWFTLDPESGMLDYYVDKDKKKLGPRGSVYLGGAVVSPSEEDSFTFGVSAANGDVFRLRGIDAKERQHWITRLRSVTEFHSTSIAEAAPPLVIHTCLYTQSTSSTTSTLSPSKPSSQAPLAKTIVVPSSTPAHTLHMSSEDSFFKRGNTPFKSVPSEVSNLMIRIRNELCEMENTQTIFIDQLEMDPEEVESIFPLDERILLLKATAQSTLSSLHHSFSILQRKVAEVHQDNDSSEMNSNHPNGANDRFKSHGEKPSSDGRHFSFHRNPSTRGSARKAAEKETKKTSASETTCCERGMLDAEAGIAALRDGGEVTDEEPYCVGEEPENQSVEEHKSVILHLVSQLKLGMDLTKVVLPTFILEPRSTLEMFADFFAHPDLFTRIPDGLTSEDRMLSVLEFYLTSFHVGRKGALAKKPYNPILGETFHCSWDVNNLTGPPRGDQSEVTGQADGHSEEERKVRFVSEQVSHHPPISGIYAECPSKGLSFNANIWTKSKFYGMSIGVVNAGEGVITLLQHDEEYVFTFPNAYCRSILTLPWVELGGKIHITCAKSGYNAAITFHTKPVYGGKLHRVTGDVKNTTTGKVFCKVNGEWNGKIEINFTSKQEEPRVLDTKELQLYRKRVSPLADQTEMESRRVWQNVTSGLQSKDINSATSAKHALEEKQRKEARERKESNVEWKTQLFHAHGDGWMFNNHIKLRTKRDNEASKPTE